MITYNGENALEVIKYCKGYRIGGPGGAPFTYSFDEGLNIKGRPVEVGLTFDFWDDKYVRSVEDEPSLKDHVWSHEDVMLLGAGSKSVQFCLTGVDGHPEFEINEDDFMAIGKHMGYFS